jgi:hypothetical protein
MAPKSTPHRCDSIQQTTIISYFMLLASNQNSSHTCNTEADMKLESRCHVFRCCFGYGPSPLSNWNESTAPGSSIRTKPHQQLQS